MIFLPFNCSICSGVCCLNPPTLINEEEVLRAIELGGKVTWFEIPQGITISVDKKDNHCWFFDHENNNCSIHEQKFEMCKAYTCQAIGKDVLELNLPTDLLLRDQSSRDKLYENEKNFNFTFDYNFIKSLPKDQIRELTIAQYMSTVMANKDVIIDKCKSVIFKIKKAYLKAEHETGI